MDQTNVAPQEEPNQTAEPQATTEDELDQVAGGVTNNPLYQGAGAQTNPLYQDLGTSGTNPLYKA